MNPADIANLISEDGPDPISDKVVYVNRLGQKQVYNIVSELTEDGGSVWIVALAGTGRYNQWGSFLGSSRTWSNVKHRMKTMGLFPNPHFTPEVREAAKRWEEAFKEWLAQREIANQPNKDAFGIDDVDELSGPNIYLLRDEFEEIGGPKPIDTWHSTRRRTDSFKRISLVKSRVQSGLIGDVKPVQFPLCKCGERIEFSTPQGWRIRGHSRGRRLEPPTGSVAVCGGCSLEPENCTCLDETKPDHFGNYHEAAMHPEDIARFVSEDVSADMIGIQDPNSSVVIYFNRDGDKRQFKIIPEMTEDHGSVWTVALAGTGLMGQMGARVPTSNRKIAKNYKSFRNPDWDPEIARDMKKWDMACNEWIDAELARRAEAAANPSVHAGIDDVDEVGRSDRWGLRLAYARVGGPRPLGTWMSKIMRNDTFKRITLVKSRVQSGLPYSDEPIADPKTKGPDGYWTNY